MHSWRTGSVPRSSCGWLAHFRATAVILLSYGIATYGIDVLGTLSGTVDSALVIGFLTSSSLGLYSVSLAASRLINVISNSINAVIFPKASGLSQEDALGLVERAARVGFAASFVAGAVFTLALPILLPLLYGRAFSPVIPVTRLLTLETIIGSTIATYGQAFMATGRPLIVTLFQFIGLCSTVPLMFVLIPRFGLMGAAISLLISTGIRFVFISIAFPIVLKVKTPSLMITRADIRFLRARFAKIA